jgi:hypothetical protein
MRNDEIIREEKEKEEPEITKGAREAIRILNADRSTLKRDVVERALVRECIKKSYDIIRKCSAAKGKYLPWVDTSSPIDSNDADLGYDSDVSYRWNDPRASVVGGMDNVVEKISVPLLVEEKKISRPDTSKPSINIIQGAEDHAAAEEEGCP